jgi:sarcosine oxidase subunit delta
MMQIPCPHCGNRDQAEFVYERAAESVFVPGRDDETALDQLYTRTNLRGVEDELWRHTYGCRAWLVLTRDRVSHEVSAVRPIGPEALP